MTVYSGRDPRTGRALDVAVEGATIESVTPSDADPGALSWLSPGLIDLQVNGYGGHDVNGDDVSPETVTSVTRALASAGTTTYVPTVVTATEDAMTASIRAVVDARKADPATHHAVPFVHLEGPYISPEDGPRGVHDAGSIRPPDVAELRRMQELACGLIGMVTISPHHDGAVEFTQTAVAMGIRVAIGHTHASPEEIRAVVDAGAGYSTHLGNGAHAVIRRHPNYIWTQLAEDRLTAGFIADGHHLPADALTTMLRAKGTRALLVSDSVALAGMEPGVYDAPVGGQVELDADGRLAEKGTPYLAGAARPLADGVATCCATTGLALADVLDLATRRPGCVVGNRGHLEPGTPADLLLFDYELGERRLRVKAVVTAGREL